MAMHDRERWRRPSLRLRRSRPCPRVAAAPAVHPLPRRLPCRVAAVPAVAPAPSVAGDATPASRPARRGSGALRRVAAVAPMAAASQAALRANGAALRDGARRRDGMMLSGDLDDMKEVEARAQHLHGDFLWFRRDGVGYVVQDAALLARAPRLGAGRCEVAARWRRCPSR
jgi:hypothetical protein